MDERQHWMQCLDEFLQFRRDGGNAEGTIADDKTVVGQWISYALERNVRPDERNHELLRQWVTAIADLAPMTQDNCRAHMSPWWQWNSDDAMNQPSVRDRPPQNRTDSCGGLFAPDKWGPSYCACGSLVSCYTKDRNAATYCVCRKTGEVVWVGAPIDRTVGGKRVEKVVEATRSPSYRIGDTWLGIPRPGVDPGPRSAESLPDGDDDDAESDTADERLVSALRKAAEDLLCGVGFLYEIVELLEDKGQVILYGPPGTGKTYFAQRLAKALVGSSSAAEAADEDWMQRLDAYCLYLEQDQEVQSGRHRSIVRRWIEFAHERELDPSVWDETRYVQFADLNPSWQDSTRDIHSYDLRRWCRWASDGEGFRGRDSTSLIQFHPAYSYEDFFEGFRPAVDDAGNMTYRLTPGPLVQIAERARANPEQRHVMVIDEINRANLPQVLGELLFLLEYRDRAVHTQYRPDSQFSLPENLWFIGTMNTADRSIALIDAAMRRRFHFVPFFPNHGPTAGLLRRWMGKHAPGQQWIADLVDAVNGQLAAEIGGDHLLIGPTHFMKRNLDTEALRRIWQYNIEPLIEDQLFGRQEAINSFRLDAVWKRHGPDATSPRTQPGASDDAAAESEQASDDEDLEGQDGE